MQVFKVVGTAAALCAAVASSSDRHSSNSTIFNPIIPGFHPDPSCISVPEYNWTFFCASSSFSAFPGVPIHASKDLIDWRLVSNALSRPDQLPDLSITNGSTSGVWAPTLRYHDGTFYVMTTLVFDHKEDDDASRWDNFILTSTDPFSSDSWSDPIHFDYLGYDTSPFWDDDGTTYVTGSHPWHVYPAITQSTIDLSTGETGEASIIWNGTGGLAPEGPHIYKRDDGYYYLLIAEGGTGVNHEVTMTRAKSINGPYFGNEDPGNPVLTQANTSSYFQTVGHADLFEDQNGNWWGMALSTRSGPEYEVYPMGRETVLTAVTWEDGEWPVWTNVSGAVSGWPLPSEGLVTEGEGPLVTASEYITFAPGTALPPQFVHWRIPVTENYVVSADGHEQQLELKSSVLNLTGYDGNYAGPQGQTFVSRRQVDTFFTFSVTLDYSSLKDEGDEAGVSVFLTQNHHFDLGLVMLPTSGETDVAPHLRFRGESYLPVPEDVVMPVNETWLGEPLTMEIKAFNLTHYSLSAGPRAHQHLIQTLAYAPANAVSFGFTGTLIGAYCTTNGREGDAVAWVGDWTYVGQGQVRS